LVLPDLATANPWTLPAQPPAQAAPRAGTAGSPATAEPSFGEQGSAESSRPGLRLERDGDLSCTTILVIDDDVLNVFGLTSTLEMPGMTVLYADNGRDGVALLNDHPYVDMVLMDAMMPEMDGNQTTRTIRANPRFADLPVVFLTAKAMPGDREASL